MAFQYLALPVGSAISLVVTDSAGAVQNLTATVVAGGTYSVDVPAALARRHGRPVELLQVPLDRPAAERADLAARFFAFLSATGKAKVYPLGLLAGNDGIARGAIFEVRHETQTLFLLVEV